MRDYKEIEDVDLKLLLLSGSDIKVNNFLVKPYILREIKDYGYSDYMRNLQWLSITIDDFIKSVLDIEKRMYLQAEKSKLKSFDFYVKFGGKEMLEDLLKALAMVFKTWDVRVLDEEKGIIVVDFVVNGILKKDKHGEYVIDEEALEKVSEEKIIMIDRNNFDNIVEVVKLQNYLSKISPKKTKESNPADEETRKLLEQMEENRKKVEAKKKRQQQEENGDDDGDIDLSDIISAVSSKSNSLNKLNIWDLTLYQLYDEYARLELIDNYDFSIKAMMAGAEKIDLKHWSSKI